MGAADVITSAQGNLLTADVDALVNTVNTVGIMGKGIALQFRRAYPEMFKAYERACKSGDVRLGHMHVWETGSLQGPRFIINFPTKKHWKSNSKISDIEAGLDDLVRVIVSRGITSIAIPPLGCGHGGLQWNDVQPRIISALAPVWDSVDIRIFPPEGAPPARAMVDRTAPPRLTRTRAALLVLMHAYRERTLEDPNLVAVQKLGYLLQSAGEPLKLEFARGHYGPYADNLRKTLRSMEGHQIDGFGDGSASVRQAETLSVRPIAAQAATDLLAHHPDTGARVASVLRLIEGYESPYGLELLASVHWVAQMDPAALTGPEPARQHVREWNARKAAMFTPEHVYQAWERLHEQGWLGSNDRIGRPTPMPV